jgi:hypothetical protein
MAVPAHVVFNCSACNARLKASIRLVGKARTCPACREHIVMHPVAPAPADAVLVLEDIPMPPHTRPGWNLQV